MLYQPKDSICNMTVSIFINSAGPNVIEENIFDTLSSFKQDSCFEEFYFYYVVDTQSSYQKVKNVIDNLRLFNKTDVKIDNSSWATCYNKFYDEYGKKSDYVILSHDDLKIETKDFYQKTKKIIENSIENIGWVTFTNTGYYKQFNIPLSNSVREGFCIDRNNKYLFECHKFSNNELFSEHKLALPSKPVKCHAPFTHLVLFKPSLLGKLAYCEDWSPYTLLIDEDWGLSSLMNNFTNVWIPEISYIHPLRYSERSIKDIRYSSSVHEKFLKKWDWNFSFGGYSDDYINNIKKNFSQTNLCMSIGKFSYDWQYIK